MEEKEISETGFWNAETAHIHHVHSPELAQAISVFLKEKDKRVYDLGCGLGLYLKHLEEQGFTNLVGFEGDPPKQRVFDNIWKRDLTKPIDEHLVTGNVIMLEVGEHIPKQYEETLMDNVCMLCRGYLVLSWAIPGQPGFGHVNCKTNEEVIEMFQQKGFRYDDWSSQWLRSFIKDNTPWFKNTLMVFNNE